jgi:hypothetical protein
MSMRNWQEEGVRLAGVLVDAVEIIHEALPQVRNPGHRAEIERFLASGGKAPLPSEEALRSLEGAVIAVRMMSRKEK